MRFEATGEALRRRGRGTRTEGDAHARGITLMSSVDGRAVKIRVCALPVTEDEQHAYLTHFQQSKAPFERVKTVRVMCAPSETVRQVKLKVQEALGERVEMLKRGGAPGGIELEDSQTLEELGFTRDFSVWEYLWVDSAERLARMEEDKEKMMSFIHVHTNDMTPKMIRMLKELCPPR